MDHDKELYSDYQAFVKDSNQMKSNFDYVQESLVEMKDVSKVYLP